MGLVSINKVGSPEILRLAAKGRLDEREIEEKGNRQFDRVSSNGLRIEGAGEAAQQHDLGFSLTTQTFPAGIELKNTIASSSSGLRFSSIAPTASVTSGNEGMAQ
jgi:hypothetical protein